MLHAQQLPGSGLSCEAFNLLLPAGMTILGPQANLAALEAYAHKAFSRAAKLGAKVAVFGSGGARRLPESTTCEDGWQQMKAACRVLADVGLEYGIQIVIEPLNSGDCDLVHTVSEALQMAKEVDHQNLRILADTYHMLLENESLCILPEAGDMLQHCHIACSTERRFPCKSDLPACQAFVLALKQAGYHNRVSVEGIPVDFAADACSSAEVLRGLLTE